MTSPSSSPTAAELVPQSAGEPKLSSLVNDLSQNVLLAMDNMLKMTNEIDQNSAAITEEIGKYRDSVLQRKIKLEEEKDQFQKTATAILDMLNGHGIN